MKKIIVLFMSLIFLTGCTNINNNSIDVINNKILSKINIEVVINIIYQEDYRF